MSVAWLMQHLEKHVYENKDAFGNHGIVPHAFKEAGVPTETIFKVLNEMFQGKV